MALLGNTGNETLGDYGLLPKNDYVLEIVKSGNKPSKSSAAIMLSMQFQVLEGEYEGRFIFQNFMRSNTSDGAIAYADKCLNAIKQATGQLDAEDSEELHEIPFIGSVVVKPPNQYFNEESNEIKAFKPLGSGKKKSLKEKPEKRGQGNPPLTKEGGEWKTDAPFEKAPFGKAEKKEWGADAPPKATEDDVPF